MGPPYRAPERPAPLAKLAALPATPVNELLAACFIYRPYAGGVLARPALLHDARAAGFTHIGNCLEAYVFRPFTRYTSQVWVDADRTTQARVSMRGYHFATYFESGRCVLTWDHPPRTQSSARLRSNGVAGRGFAGDYADHLVSVEEWRAAGEVPIAVRDVGAASALGLHYYRFVSGTGVALRLLAFPVVLVLIVGFEIWRRLRPR